MREIVGVVLVLALYGCTKATAPPPRVSQPAHQTKLATRAEIDTAVLDAVVGRLKIERTVPNGPVCETQAQAQVLLLHNLHLVHSPSSSPFAEHKGYFLFSGIGSELPDDGSFETGFAVKRGTSEIYGWRK